MHRRQCLWGFGRAHWRVHQGAVHLDVRKTLVQGTAHCARMPSWVLNTFMPEWEWRALLRPDGPEEAWSGADPDVPKAASTCCGRYSWEMVISQSNFGWPESRPRLYHVGVLKADGFLRAPGLQLLNQLREQVELDVTCLFTAPEERMCLFP